MYPMDKKQSLWMVLIMTGLVSFLAAAFLLACRLAPPQSLPGPPPIPDRLAESPLPPNPTQLERSRHLYWMN